MTAQTYVDAVGAMARWINSRTATLVGEGNPLPKGATFKHLDGALSAPYAYLEELPATTFGAENPDMNAWISAQVYGGTREAATAAAVALCEEISTSLAGVPVAVTGATLFVADDISGPSWAPDGDLPRLLVQFVVRMRPA